MKILVAVQADNAKELARKTLTWAPRAGFSFRVFIPDDADISKYHDEIDDVNYNHYLDMNYSMLVQGSDPQTYAKAEGYDLLLLLPPDLSCWKRNNNRDKMIVTYATEVGAARVKLGLYPEVADVKFDNGAIMVRI